MTAPAVFLLFRIGFGYPGCFLCLIRLILISQLKIQWVISVPILLLEVELSARPCGLTKDFLISCLHFLQRSGSRSSSTKISEVCPLWPHRVPWLNDNGPIMLICLNTLSPVCGTLWERFGVVALWQEVCHQGRLWGFKSLLPSQCALYFLLVVWGMSSQLLVQSAGLLLATMLPRQDGLLYPGATSSKQTLSSLFSGRGVFQQQEAALFP